MLPIPTRNFNPCTYPYLGLFSRRDTLLQPSLKKVSSLTCQPECFTEEEATTKNTKNTK